MDDAVAFRALDPERVLARLSASRWALVRTVMAARIGIAAASLLLAARPGDGPGGSWWNLGAFAAYLVWTVATGLAARRVSDLLARAPRWFWLEQAICVGLVVLGGGVRSITLYLCAMPVILATVLIGPRLGVMLAAGDSVAVAAALGGAALLGRTPGTQAADGTVWPPALIGLFVAVGLFAYVRRLFAELEQTGTAYRARSHEITAAVAAEARAQARVAALADLSRSLDGTIPDIKGRLAAVRLRAPSGEPWHDECDQLERLADYAQGSLDSLTPELATAGPGPAICDVLMMAVTRVAALGASAIDHRFDRCDIALENDAAAEALGRFVEEALWNAHRHGRAPISLTATVQDSDVVVTVTDHGDGFHPTAGSARLGQASLQRDAGVLRGVVLITNEPGRPVSVALTFPVPIGA
jgi:hypothetical protein